MDKLEFRLLDKEEIECRVQSVMKDNSGCILLLYKTARTDYNLLDEVVGAMNWKCDYKEIKGNLYCEIAIYNKDLQQWISKSNCGVESNTEAEKGEASDSLKRAGFVWGIGRELYTAPFTYIKLNADDFQNSKLKTQFKVKEIGYTNRTITKLIIEDNKGNVRFTYGNVEKVEAEVVKPKKTTKKPETQKDQMDILYSKVENENYDLPFELEEKEKDEMSALWDLRNIAVDKLKMLGKKPVDCYTYYAKKWHYESEFDFTRENWNEIINDLDKVLKSKGLI